MQKIAQSQMSNETRRGFYGTILGVWAIVTIYAVLHDQYLVSISPIHFTEYHFNPLGISNAHLLAAYCALLAAVSPGLALGVAAWFVGRSGKAVRMKPMTIWKATLVTVVATECMAAGTGYFAHLTGVAIYPKEQYPELTRGILTTQTIQITSYLAGAATSVAMLLWMAKSRWIKRTD